MGMFKISIRGFVSEHLVCRYLIARGKLGPEVKFTYPQTISMEYGWKINERPNTKRSEYARSFIVKNSFFRPAGIIIGPP